MPVEGGGSLEWDEQVALFVSPKVWLTVKIRLRSRHSFKALPLHVRGGGEASAMTQLNHPCFPDSVIPSCISFQSVPSGYSSLLASSTEHYYSSFPTPNSDPAPLLPLPSPWQWAWVFSDLGSQPAVAFPLGQLVEWFQCVGHAHCKLDTEESVRTRIFYFRDNKEDWKCEQGLHCMGYSHCLPVVTLGMIFTLCMSWFLYLFWATPHTCRILVPWPEIPALESEES